MSTKLKWFKKTPIKPGYYWYIARVYILIQADAKADGCKVGNIFDRVGLALINRDFNNKVDYYCHMYEMKRKSRRLFVPIWVKLNPKEVAWWAGPFDHGSVIRPRLSKKINRLIND
jgi:hypothetical protein